MKNANDIEDALMRDANGREFRFDRLFGDSRKPPPRLNKPANKERVSNCLLQLTSRRNTVGQSVVSGSVASVTNYSGSNKEPDNSESGGILSTLPKEVDYVEGVTSPWASIDFNIVEGLQHDVGFRTRVDCGLAIEKVQPVSPNRRQLRILQAAALVEGDKYPAELGSPERQADVVPERPSLLKQDSQLQLKYLT